MPQRDLKNRSNTSLPVEDKKGNAQWEAGVEFYDAAKAQRWDDRPRFSKAVCRGIRKRVQLLNELGCINDECRVLSVGCGTGHHEELVSNNGLVCLDVSNEMLKRAIKRRNNCVLGTAYQLPFPDNSFDCVFAINLAALHNQPQDLIMLAISEMQRTVRQGGKVIVMTKNTFRAALNCLIRHGNPKADHYRVSNRSIEQAFVQNGLTIERCLGVGYLGIRPIWGDLILSRLGLGLLANWFVCSGRKE